MDWREYSHHNPETVYFFTSGTHHAMEGAARILSLAKTGTPEQREAADRIIWEDDDIIGFDELWSQQAEAHAPGCDIYTGYLVILALRVGIDTPPLKTSIIDAIMRDDDRSFAKATSARMAQKGWSDSDIKEFNRAACAIWS